MTGRLTLPFVAILLAGVAVTAAAAGPDPAAWARAGGPIPRGADLAPYLAAAKVAAAEATRGARTTATPNQGQWDARWYGLDVHPDINAHSISGSATIRATVTAGPLVALDLDFYDNMLVDAVTIHGGAATYARAANVLTVHLDRSYATGETVEVLVQYHGTPSNGAFGAVFGFQSVYGRISVWTLSEPFGARQWWPCKDDPSDKADSVEVRVTMPTGFITASNGVRDSANDNGTTAFVRWRERHPIATYLVSLASYPYATHTDWYRPSPTDSMPIQFYAFPEVAAGAAPYNALVKSMIAAYSARFGEYPFFDEKYGEAQMYRGGGMENQTCTSVGEFSDALSAHELGHSWWGDNVTCDSFHHVWLNEGFASWCEALWAEVSHGDSAYHAVMEQKKYLGGGTVYVPSDSSSGRIFDYNTTYNKGAWTLHMLRHLLGDSTFYASLREYRRRHAYGNATTEDLQAACESISGRSLAKFFQQWIYGEYAPDYRGIWDAQPAGGGYDVTVHLAQMQSAQTFWMPVDVRIDGQGGGTFHFVAWDSLATQDFTYHVSQAPKTVTLDPDSWVLCTTAAGQLDTPIAGGGVLRLMPARPNPARGATAFAVWLPRPAAVTLEVFDVSGARVRRVETGRSAAGWSDVVWDGRDAIGRTARPGVYTARVTAAGQALSRRVALIP